MNVTTVQWNLFKYRVSENCKKVTDEVLVKKISYTVGYYLRGEKAASKAVSLRKTFTSDRSTPNPGSQQKELESRFGCQMSILQFQVLGQEKPIALSGQLPRLRSILQTLQEAAWESISATELSGADIANNLCRHPHTRSSDTDIAIYFCMFWAVMREPQFISDCRHIHRSGGAYIVIGF